MAIAFDTSGNTVITTAVTTINVDITAAAVGATCYAGITNRGTITVPSGWTQIGTANGDATETANVLMRRVKQAGDTTFAIAVTASDRQCVVWASYTGVDSTTPDSGTATNYWAAHTSLAAFVSGSVTNTFTNGWAVTVSLNSSSSAQRTWTPDAALTERQDQCSSVNTFNGAQLADSNGVVTAAAHSYTNTLSAAESHGGVYLIYLNPSSGGGGGGGGTGNITFDSSGNTINNASGTSVVIDITTAATGATCYAFLATGIQTGNPTLTGWTAVGVRNDEGATTSCMLFRRVKQAGDTTFTMTLASTFKATLVWSSYLGVDPTTPDDGAGTYVAQTGSANYANTLSNTFTNGWAVQFGFPRSTTAGRTCTPDAAMVERQDVVNNASVWFTSTVDDSNGAVTVASHTYTMVASGSDSHGGSMLIYLKPAPSNTSPSLVSQQAALIRSSRW